MMPSLTDLRVLVLDGSPPGAQARSDLDLLVRRTTTHILPVGRANRRLTVLRVGKRLAMGQDDLLILYCVPRRLARLLTLLSQLWKRPVLRLTLREQSPALLQAVAQLTGRPWPAAGRTPLRLDLGCGSQHRPGFLGIDARRTPATAILGDARAIPIGSGLADEVYASCLLEHFDDPHTVLREIHRLLRPDGQAVLRLPNLGTYSSHLDTTHRFLADLALWRRILAGYFGEVHVVPVGTKYRDNRWLVRINWLLVNLLQWYELAQGWDFICRKPRAGPSIEYLGWWEE